jgi:hypothetical protein
MEGYDFVIKFIIPSLLVINTVSNVLIAVTLQEIWKRLRDEGYI